MEYSTPTQSRLRHSSSSSSLNDHQSTPSTPVSARPKKRFASHSRDPRVSGTPVNKLLARERIASIGLGSPRKVRTRSWSEKAVDYPSNLVLSLSTSYESISFDALGLPIAISLNVLHLLIKLPQFLTFIPRYLSRTTAIASGKDRFFAKANELKNVDARLQALKRNRQEMNQSSNNWFWTIFSISLVMLSVGNAIYLLSRRRKYQLMLRQDPLASPNARSASFDLKPPSSTIITPRRTFFSLLASAFSFLWKLIFGNSKNGVDEDEVRTFQIQELNVWTPEYVKWSLQIFTLYPPPLALLYHFLTPLNAIPFALIGGLFVFQTSLSTHQFTQLLQDRKILQSEVMNEYNQKFVHPRIFVRKIDFATSTIDQDFEGFKEEYRRNSGLGRGIEEVDRRVRRYGGDAIDDGEEDEEGRVISHPGRSYGGNTTPNRRRQTTGKEIEEYEVETTRSGRKLIGATSAGRKARKSTAF